MTLHIALSLLQNLGLCVDFCVAAVQALCVVVAFILLSDAIAFEKKCILLWSRNVCHCLMAPMFLSVSAQFVWWHPRGPLFCYA